MFEIVTLTQALDSLTLMRHIAQTPPMLALRELCGSIAANDFDNAVSDYCELTGALLDDYRRVTGDVWKDFMFDAMLESPHRFAACYAKQRSDHALDQALACDLELLKQLFDLSSEKVLGRIGEVPGRREKALQSRREVRAEHKKPDREEQIKGMAGAAWTGLSFKERERDRERERERERDEVVTQVEPEPEKTKEQLRIERLPGWNYDEPVVHKPYASDVKLALLYRLFIATDDWRLLVEPMKAFYLTYGSGQFLRYRTFVASDEGLIGIDKFCDVAWDDLFDDKSRKSIIYDNIDSLVTGGSFQNMLLYGNGRGKTTAIEAICEQIEELRLVYVNCKSVETAAGFVQTLADQPLKFVVLMDDLALRDFEYRKLKGAFSAMSASNVLLCATAKTKLYDDSFFKLCVEFDEDM